MAIVFLIAKININPYFPKKIYGKILSASYFLPLYLLCKYHINTIKIPYKYHKNTIVYGNIMVL